MDYMNRVPSFHECNEVCGKLRKYLIIKINFGMRDGFVFIQLFKTVNIENGF